jgi:CHAT domain-containing protein
MRYTFRPLFQARELSVLSKVLFKQGRYSEAEYVAKCAINKYITHGADCSSIFLNLSTQVLAKSLAAQERWEKAIEQFEAIRDVLSDLDLFEIRFSGDADWAIALLATGQIAKALEQLETGLEYTSEQFGQNHYRTAIIRGLLAVAHAANDDKRAALKGFAEAVPILLKTYRKAGTEAFTRFTKDPHLILIIETYMNLLADIRDTPLEKTMEVDAVNVSFSLADFVRAHSVQRVMASAGARYAVKDPELADIVRREQDARKHLDVLYATLANAVAQERTDQNLEVIESLKEKIGKLSKARLTFIKEIELRFPQYAQLINPVPPSLKEARASLNPGESLLSIYIGRDQSFVWAVPYEGKVMFATPPLGKKEIDTMVDQIRSTLEPNAKTLGDIPQFDLVTAYVLFQAFFEPVREAWNNAKSLLVVPHGALSYLPFSLLPTEQVVLPADKNVLFENYKQVLWLVRSHSVTVLPSVSTLILLRAMSLGDRAQLPFVGFGDPYFNEHQARTAAKTKRALQIASSKQPGDYVLRGLSIKRVQTDQLDSAQIEVLHRLPETAEEIRSMALAMNADPNRDVFTGAQANEQQVKTMDLSRYKVIAFATHGLAPGDLDGLLQPALALSSPKVALIDGDGLLAMEEIFGLRLNADWIVLSACNTGAGKEEGAEALSGLCRAFFYAGTRALLVTNWPVETNSAKALTTDLFKGQAQNPLLTRAEALRQSKLSLIDEVGHIDPESGKLLFSYAHPIFWAAFSLIGG